MGIMILRIKDPDRERPFRVPGGTYLLPILGALSCVGLAIYLPPSSWWRFVYWLAAGMVIYVGYGYRHSRLRNPHATAGAPPPPGYNPEQQLPESDVRDRK
jgi:APA family basic amino acid/polyamine antiporter